MTTQREKMISGELYDPFDPALLDARRRASVLCQQLGCSSADPIEQARTLKELIPGAGPGLLVQPPFHCDYGTHITAGRNVDQGAVIGAGSVVTKNIPARVLAVGNPCRVIRRLAL
jgi:hypothetical protein